MNIEIIVDPSRGRRWHVALVDKLNATVGLHVACVSRASPSPAPHAVELLLRLEAVLLRRRGVHASDRIDPMTIEAAAGAASVTPDLVIDLAGAGAAAPRGARRLRPLFDGSAGEDPLLAALLDRRMPTIEVEDVSSGAIVAAAVPSGECARGIADGIEAVSARLVTLLVAALQGRGLLQPGMQPRPAAVHRPTLALAARYWTRTLARKAARELYALCCYTPHWRIGWRWVTGDDVWDRHDLGGQAWNTLPDPGYRFFADPVPFVWRGRAFMFFEDLDHRTEKGVISVVELGRDGPVGGVRTVLEEPWHLSYPFLIEHAGEIWMIPESSTNRDVALYRASEFPFRWEREATLLSGIEAGDATVVQRNGRFWMFAATREGGGGWSDTLSVFHAPDLLGPWIPHPGNPLLIDRAAARPAGNVVERGGRLWRPVQDCTHGYGGGIGLAEITRLDTEGFTQVVHKVLRPGPAWPGRRLHTLNRAGALECIDGSAAPVKLLSPRPRRVAPARATIAGAPAE